MTPTPIQLDTDTHINKITDTTPEQAQANTRFAIQAEIDKWNASKVLDYEVQWKQYVLARDQRPDATNLTVPVPARAEAVFVDERGWPYVDTSDKPVIAPHTYVPAAKTPGGFFSVTLTSGPAPDPWMVKILDRVDYHGMRFLRVA